MTARVNVEDLLGAADWLRAYEGPDGPVGDHGAGGDGRAEELLRVAEWLDAEVARRRFEQQVREVAAAAAAARGLPADDPKVRAAARRVLRKEAQLA